MIKLVYKKKKNKAEGEDLVQSEVEQGMDSTLGGKI